jgi:hypothetical protein
MTNLPSSILIFLKIFLFLFPLITSQFDDPSLSKLIACMSVLHEEFKSQEPDQSISSAMMLKCFMTITDSQSRSFLLGLETGKSTLSKSEIKKLLDYETLKDMSPNVLKSKSNELDRALKKFRKIQEDYMGGREPEGDEDYDDYDYEDEYGSERPSNINFFSLIPKGIFGIIGVFSNYISLFIIFVLVYFFLLALRKMNDSAKKQKKKKKVEFDYDEFDDDDEDGENTNKSNNRNTNSKNNKNKSKNEKGNKKDIKND